jgi:RNA polymerase sigma factor (TIGR02999 family)
MTTPVSPPEPTLEPAAPMADDPAPLRRYGGRWRLPGMCDFTHMLSAIEHVDGGGAERVLPLVYEELRKLATQRLAREAPGQSFHSSDLVHEAYLRLVGEDVEKQWDSRAHFFAAAAEAMRRILVEGARRKKRVRHGGGRLRVELKDAGFLAQEPSEALEALDLALTKLAEEDPDKAELVKLRFFAGLTMPEIARVLKISLATAERHWTYARTWLYAELKDRGHSADPQESS